MALINLFGANRGNKRKWKMVKLTSPDGGGRSGAQAYHALHAPERASMMGASGAAQGGFSPLSGQTQGGGYYQGGTQSGANGGNTSRRRRDDANDAWSGSDTMTNTGAASDEYGGAGAYQNANDAGSFEDYYNRLIAALQNYGVELSLPTLDELYAQLSAFLRPSVDAAIEGRKRYGETTMAELDADAYSRGMGGSSYLSSMKSREYDDIARDIASMESNYNSTLAEYLYNASNELARIQAQFASMALQHSYDMQKLYASQTYGGSGRGGSGKAGGAEASAQGGSGGNYESNYNDYVIYLESRSEADRRNIFHSNDPYWAAIRENLRNSVSSEMYNRLVRLYDPGAGGGGGGGKPGAPGWSNMLN